MNYKYNSGVVTQHITTFFFSVTALDIKSL